ncbi:homocysteine S-methyltransferase family protein [Maribacter sp. ANRC-HE7]|uniref:Homocysteine S-methyltransferase family protein n=1 Tax=Maribacter aquimaris TaxID=2737171 RepID=A0ABR7V120_9FLAO|nr:homocysteine S-methyltransferase family protein [Maribacter aquimaris]MBD0777619.1 homocysteine S-methyltransferase family protein [Maribacter aquimaris]
MKHRMKDIIATKDFILMEGAVIEILRRSGKVSFHPDLINTPMIYDTEGSKALSSIFKAYIDIAQKKDLPFVMCTPTWRANKANVHKSGIRESVNRDAVAFMKKLRDTAGDFSEKILIGGTVGPKNDCYTPSVGLSAKEAEEFHAWQLLELQKGGVDFIIAETIPNIQEALGLARAAAKLEIDYIISFVISRNGKILDGTDLGDAMELIDKHVNKLPLGYAINCAHPTFLCADKQPKQIFERLIAFLGNASSLDHCDLENSDALQVDNVTDWGDGMLRLNREFGIKILGGCCGTDQRHLEYLTMN